VEIIDAELIMDKEYASMGKKPAVRVEALLEKPNPDKQERIATKARRHKEELFITMKHMERRHQNIEGLIPTPSIQFS